MNEPKPGLQPDRECETVAQVIHRYTDGYEEWLDVPLGSCNCLSIAVNDMQLLIARIAELETWHPASDPPEKIGHTVYSRDVLVETKNGNFTKDYYSYQFNEWWRAKGDALRWRDLPERQPNNPE